MDRIPKVPLLPDDSLPESLLEALERTIDTAEGIGLIRLTLFLHCFPEHELFAAAISRANGKKATKIAVSVLPDHSLKGLSRERIAFTAVWDMFRDFVRTRDVVAIPPETLTARSIRRLSRGFERWVTHCSVTYKTSAMPVQASEHIILVEVP